MTQHVQPDLFGELDRAEARQAAWNAPGTCPSCGTQEPNGYLLNTNHGYQPDAEGVCGFPRGAHPIYGAMCTAQYLVSNHITYAARRGDVASLAERQDRGRELGLDVEAITRDALTSTNR